LGRVGVPGSKDLKIPVFPPTSFRKSLSQVTLSQLHTIAFDVLPCDEEEILFIPTNK